MIRNQPTLCQQDQEYATHENGNIASKPRSMPLIILVLITNTVSGPRAKIIITHQTGTSRNSGYQNQQTFLLRLSRFQRGHSNQ